MLGRFISGKAGPLFLLSSENYQNCDRCVLVIPPFAEEMNKTRKMISDLAKRLEIKGIAVVIPDLFGTGDSAGEFAEATWDIWIDDLQRVVHWTEHNLGPLTGIVATRLGCAIANELARLRVISNISRTVFWQPTLDCSRYMNQFLRLRTAASMMIDKPESLNTLRARLSGGEALEIAGYELSGVLFNQLSNLPHPQSLALGLGEVCWFDIVRDASGTDVSAAAAKFIEISAADGHSMRYQTISGEPFWSATEIVVNEELLDRTAEFLIGTQKEISDRPVP